MTRSQILLGVERHAESLRNLMNGEMDGALSEMDEHRLHALRTVLNRSLALCEEIPAQIDQVGGLYRGMHGLGFIEGVVAALDLSVREVVK